MNQAKESLKILSIPSFETYSYHSFADYVNYSYLKHELQSLKIDGLINQIGISVYSNAELNKVLCDKDIDVIQLPYNLLDNQNIRGSYIKEAKQNNKEIHIRSIFLQGLFFMDEASIPEKLIPLKPYIRRIKFYCENESINLQSLALSYAIFNKQIDHVLIGVDTKLQLLNNINSIKELKNEFDFINQYINVKETELLNPFNWK
jgi:aryl-alcohol dehydrogenase-like predicted oxidoreductase